MSLGKFKNKHGKWDDIQINVSLAKAPAVNDPTWRDWDYGIGGGVQFKTLGFGVGDNHDIFIQTSHKMRIESILSHHIHYSVPSESAGDRFKFQVDVIAAGLGSQYAVPAGSPFTAEHILTAAEVGRNHLFDTASIPGVNTTISTLYICKLTRIAASADEYANEVYLVFEDGHYQNDDNGSDEEDSK